MSIEILIMKTRRRIEKKQTRRGGRDSNSHTAQIMRSSSLNSLSSRKVKSSKYETKQVTKHKKSKYLKSSTKFFAKELFRLNKMSVNDPIQTDIFYEMPKLDKRKGGGSKTPPPKKSKSSALPFAMEPPPPLATEIPTAPPMMDSCQPLTSKEIPWLESLISTGHKCLISVGKDSCRFTRSGPMSISFGKGGFNAVFNNDNFDECVGDNYILRVSIRPLVLSSSDGSKYYSNFLEETRLGIIAAEHGIGPKIYKIGIMVDINNNTQVHFYSIIDRIIGYDASEMIKTGKFKATDPTSFTVSDVIVDPYALDGTVSEAEHIANMNIQTIDTVLELTIEKLKIAGKECGFLMMDNKPPNTMVTEHPTIRDKPFVYLIDYDPQFTLLSDDPIIRELYARINVVLFLCNAHVYSKNENDTNPKKKTPTKQNSEKLRELVYDKLKREYYNLVGVFGFEHIRDYIQQLYFTVSGFAHITHHYHYTDSDLLRIHYFALYKDLPIEYVMDRMEGYWEKYKFSTPIYLFQTPISMGLPILILKRIDKYIVGKYSDIKVTFAKGSDNMIPFYALKQLHFDKPESSLTAVESKQVASAIEQMKTIHDLDYNDMQSKLIEIYEKMLPDDD